MYDIIFEKGGGNMEKILKEIVEKLNTIDERFNTIDERFNTMDERFNTMDERLNSMESTMDERFNTMDERFNTMDERFNTMDERFEDLKQDIKRLDNRITEEHRLTRKESKHEIQYVYDEVKELRQDFSTVKLVTADNMKSIAKLQTKKN